MGLLLRLRETRRLSPGLPIEIPKMNRPQQESTTEFDVIVIGSGAGGLSAAVTARKLGLSVLVLEKEPYFGGTTARSGGVLWIPCNPLSRASGIQDSVEAARTYLQHETGPHFDAERVEAFLENGPRMIEFFERHTAVKFTAVPAFSDYHPGAPGGVAGGRSIVALPYDGRLLGERIRELRPPLREITFVGMMFNSSLEVAHFFNVTRSLKSALYVTKRLAAHAVDLMVHRRGMRLTNGNALAARLAKSAFDLGVTIWTVAPARRIMMENGVARGAEAEINGRGVALTARRGVVLASGGFPQDVELRRRLFPHAPTGCEHWSPAPPGNSGDGWRLGTAVGADTVTDLSNAAAWIPVSLVPRRNGETGVFPHLIDRYKPGVIAVTRRGVRFVNEADSYHDFGQAMQRVCRGEREVAAFLICDHRTLRRYGLGYAKPFPLPLSPHLRSGYLTRGNSIADLARRVGIEVEPLQRTIEALNADARRGEDSQFGKGSTAYNRFLGDANHKPNPCVAPVEQGPFYALKVVLGDLGTFAGLRTDRSARVLDSAGRPIDGLYAVGNDAASVMGGNYPGGGITLGPALTFGFIAGRHLAEQSERAGAGKVKTRPREEARI
jgi:succinate dehydrogenase/fumarate reductase flavoprotein subunit